MLSIVNFHAIESDEPKEETLGHLLTLFKDLASKQQSYSESSWQGKTSFGIVASVMVEDLLTEAEFSLLELIALLEIPSTAAALLQQIIHSLDHLTRNKYPRTKFTVKNRIKKKPEPAKTMTVKESLLQDNTGIINYQGLGS